MENKLQLGGFYGFSSLDQSSPIHPSMYLADHSLSQMHRLYTQQTVECFFMCGIVCTIGKI